VRRSAFGVRHVLRLRTGPTVDVLGEELLVLDDQLLELLDLVAFETSVRGHDTILPRLRMNVRGIPLACVGAGTG
jgi:hypothetical protein